MFIDSSAILAILLDEQDAPALVANMQTAKRLYFSPIVRFEAIIRLASLKSGARHPVKKADVDQAEAIIDMFARQYNISLLPIRERESHASLEAYRQFGKGTGHRAQLNLGDCFSYACAKTNGLRLLFKGNDFIHTDIATASN